MDEFQHLDDYALLGVTPNASPDEIKQAYRREITKYHPDRYRNADAPTQQYARERSQRLTEAYASLARGARGRPQPMRPRSAAFTENVQRPVAQAANASQLATWYDEATVHIAAGRMDDAVRSLHKIQRVDPFYRDVDDLLAQAEASAGPRNTASNRKPLVWAGAGALALLGILGGAWGSGAFRGAETSANLTASPNAVAQSSTAVPSVTATQPVVAAASIPPAVSSSAASLVGTPAQEQVSSAPPAPSDIVVVPAASPTETAPTGTAVAPPPTEIIPTATAVTPPPTERVPTATAVAAARPTRIPPTPTRRPVAVESGQVLVADAFDNPQSGWANLQAEAYTLGYRDGTYAITTNPGTGSIFSFGAPLAQGNVVISADVTPVRGSAGLIFGPENSYRFFISGDGRYRVDLRGQSLVAPTASNAIRRGTNRLSVAAAGRRASLYVNGVLLTNLDLPASLQDTTYGFVVLAGPQGGEGVFDALTVRTLPR